MHEYQRFPRAAAGLLATLVVAMTVGFSATAWAAPAEPTMGVDELQTAIDANGGTLPGHFKTIVKGTNDDITELDVTVQAVTSGFAFGPADLGSLILFDSADPQLLNMGGIASGMSGSPLYVEVLGTDYLVGAVSYGDMFSLNGEGLATPIEAMAAIEDYAPVGFRALSAPVPTAEGVKDHIIIAPTATPELEEAAKDGALVVKPLNAFTLGGLSSRDRVFKAQKAHLEAQGFEVLAGGLSSRVSTYSADFEGGSAIAALAASGDLWAGGIGTVTYTNGDNVVAFGHPMLHSGASGLFMHNAMIDGVWSSSLTPYKIGRPAVVRGTLTQDRSAGIMGDAGLVTTPVEVNATARTADGTEVENSQVLIPPFAMNSGSEELWGLGSSAAYVASSRIGDQYNYPGSALTTTTVVVKDATSGTEYTVSRSNIVDDDTDVRSSVVYDADEIISSLQAISGNGIAKPEILSVDVESTISDDRALSEIVSVDPAAPLHTGDNTVTVSYLRFGVADTQTVDVMVNIPAGTPTTGVLSASSAAGEDYYYDEEEMFDEPEYDYGWIDRTTVADAVTALNSYNRNDVLTVSFSPAQLTSLIELEYYGPVAAKRYATISTSTTVDSAYLVGSSERIATRFVLEPWATTVAYGGTASIDGELVGAVNESEIVVTALAAGTSTPTVVASFTIDPEADEEPIFTRTFKGLKKTTTFTFTYAGDADTLPASKSVKINVQASNAFKASSTSIRKGSTSTLTATLNSGAQGKVYFERYNSSWGMWVSAGSGSAKNVTNGGSFTYKVKPSSTTKYRARFVAGSASTNASRTSLVVTVKVR